MPDATADAAPDAEVKEDAPTRVATDAVVTQKVMEVETLQEGRIQKMESKNDEKYQKELESIASKQVSPVTSKGMQDRATKSHKLRQAELKQMKDTIAASKQKRIDGHMKDACEWKTQAVESEKRFWARKLGAAWKEKAKDANAEKKFGPMACPMTDSEWRKGLSAQAQFTPYDAAAQFLLAFYRFGNVRGGKEMKITQAYFKEVLHPDCIMYDDKRDEYKIRKHSLKMLRECQPEVGASYFDSIDPAKGHPLCGYKVDEQNLVCRFKNIKEDQYTRGKTADGKQQAFSVWVHCGGTAPYTSVHREIDLVFVDGPEKGKETETGCWKVKGFRKLLAKVVEAFNPEGPETDEERRRENEYRTGFNLPPNPGFILKKGEAEYVVPEATNKLETVDIYAAQQAKDKAKRAAAKKEMTQEELDELEAHKVAAKKARQERAKEATQATAGTHELDEDGNTMKTEIEVQQDVAEAAAKKEEDILAASKAKAAAAK